MSEDEVVTRTALLDRGMSDSQIRRARECGELISVLPGLYVRADPDRSGDPVSRHRANLTMVIPYLAGEPVVSHVSAAIVHGLPFCHSEIPPLHLTRPDAVKSRRGATVQWHKAALRPGEVVEVGGLRVTTADRTVVDCALGMPFDQAVVIADAALRRGLVTRRSLRDQLAMLSRVPGVRRAATVLAFADPRSRGPGESLSRALLHRWGLPAPELAVPVFDASGQPLGRVAFAFPGGSLVGEFIEHPDAVADARREEDLADAGRRLVQWSWPDLRSPERWVERLRAALVESPDQGATVIRTVPAPTASVPDSQS